MYNGLLPAGTVVKFKNVDKLAMIAGYFPTSANENKVWDYSGVPFPEGYLGEEQMLLFDRTAIEEVEVVGYVDKKQIELLTFLTEKENEIKAGEGEVPENE